MHRMLKRSLSRNIRWMPSPTPSPPANCLYFREWTEGGSADGWAEWWPLDFHFLFSLLRTLLQMKEWGLCLVEGAIFIKPNDIFHGFHGILWARYYVGNFACIILLILKKIFEMMLHLHSTGRHLWDKSPFHWWENGGSESLKYLPKIIRL